MPAPYTIQPASMAPLYCDVYETKPDGGSRLLLTVWNKPGTGGEYAVQEAARVARMLNESEYPIGEPVSVRPSPSTPEG